MMNSIKHLNKDILKITFSKNNLKIQFKINYRKIN